MRIKRLSLRLLFVMLAGVLANNVMADCKSDYKRVGAYAQKANQLEKKGDYDNARIYYKKAARKLSGMKYRCNAISLKEMSSRERKYRLLAKHTRCGKQLQVARSYEQKAQASAARSQYQSILQNCPNSQYAKVAKSRLGGGPRAAVAKRNPPAAGRAAPRNAAGTRHAANRKAAVKSRPAKRANRSIRISRGSVCYKRHLRVAINYENKGKLALANRNFEVAANNFTRAAESYVSGSQRCKHARHRIYALDKSKQMRSRVIAIKEKHANCGEKVSQARDIQSRAYSDEQSGEFDLAQDGYMNAYRAYLSLPNVCEPQQYLRVREESLNKSKLLGCSQYVQGVKQINLAFDAMSKAKKRLAAGYYHNAAEHFSNAQAQCGFVSENNRLLNKLIRSSRLKASRLKK